MERKARPQKEQALNCPRCNSTNTKFCYYNNYSLSQPRYFCKTCRRYWTEGGTLRNVPVGGGSRKNKRSTSSSSSSPKKLPDLTIFSSQPTSHQNPNNKIHLLQLQGRQGLNLPQHHHPPLGVDGLLHFPFTTDTTSKTLHDSTNLPAALELLKAAGISSCGGSSLTSSLNLTSSSTTTMPPPPVVSDSNNSIYYYYSSHDDDHHQRDDDHQMKQPPPAKLFNFSSLHHEHHHHGLNVVENNGYHEEEPAPVVQDTDSARRLFLPYEELKPVSTATNQYHHQENKVQGESNGYWNGMLGGGGGGGGSSW